MTDQLTPDPVPEPVIVPPGPEVPVPAEPLVPGPPVIQQLGAVEPNLDYEPEADDGKADIELDLDLPEIYVPPEPVKQHIVEDNIETSIKYCFIGVGQAGGRLVQAFYKLGYRRVFAVNTAVQDLKGLNIPNELKLALNSAGSAKNRRIGKEFIIDGSEKIIAKARECFGDRFDRIMILGSLGGGTGSGGVVPIVNIMNDLVRSMGIRKANDELTRVGMMVALPSNSEADRMVNAHEAMQEIDALVVEKEVSPVVIIDNNRNDLLMRNVPVAERWHRANFSVASMFNLFNHISVQPTNHTAFDGADYASVMDSGYITLGAMVLEGFSKEVLASAFRENLKGTVLCAGLDFTTAKIAACVILGKSEIWKKVPQGDIDFAYESLARVIKEGAILHRGIYSAKRPLSVYTVVGGLDLPKERMDEIAKLAGI